ncbi:hypothetical protein WG909_14590 [Peptostreptococcaceae bacterium AGR-M142]
MISYLNTLNKCDNNYYEIKRSDYLKTISNFKELENEKINLFFYNLFFYVNQKNYKELKKFISNSSNLDMNFLKNHLFLDFYIEYEILKINIIKNKYYINILISDFESNKSITKKFELECIDNNISIISIKNLYY